MSAANDRDAVAKDEIDASRGQRRVIGDLARVDGAVGHDDEAIIGRLDDGIEDLDLLNGPGIALGNDKIAHLEWFEEQDHDPDLVALAAVVLAREPVAQLVADLDHPQGQCQQQSVPPVEELVEGRQLRPEGRAAGRGGGGLSRARADHLLPALVP